MGEQENTVLRDALTAAYEKVESGDDTEGRGEPGLGSGSDAPERETGSRADAADPAAADRARDEQGRFAKAEEARKRETLTLKGKPNAQKEQERGAAKQERVGEAETPGGLPGQIPGAKPDSNARNGGGDAGAGANATPILPPAHWNGRDKVEWERLPYHVKETLSQEYQAVSELRNLNGVLDPFKDRFTQEFGGTDRALNSILSYWKFARTQPLDFLRDFIQQSGVDPQALFGASPSAHQAQPDPSVDPSVAALQQELAAIRGQLQHVQQQPLIAQQQQIQSEVSSFGSAVDNTGKLAHPYFNDVKPVMAALMQSGQAGTLKEAYDMACYANPNVRAAMISARDQGQAEERRRAAEQARQASASVTGAPGNRGLGKPSNETVGQTLSRVYEQALSGARA